MDLPKMERGCKTPVGFMIFMRLSYTIQYPGDHQNP